ncbi:MAG: alpha-2-macroglobulin family protein [Elusimicrobiaceae bacterium]
MKTAAYLIAMMMFIPAAGSADYKDSIKKADSLFDQGRYSQALESYEPAAQDPAVPERFKAAYRSAECLALLFKYAEAAQYANTFPKTSDPVWNARFILLKTEIYRAYLNRYGHSLPAEAEKDSADITRRPRFMWENDITADYERLLPLRASLSAVPMKGEAYFIEVKNSDLRETPSLWDFAVLRWCDWLLNSEEPMNVPLPEPDTFLTDKYEIRDTLQKAVHAATLYESAAELDGPGREDAQTLWKIKRLQIPFTAPQLIAPAKDQAKLREAAIQTLSRWAREAKGELARAEALYQKAELARQNDDLSLAVETCKKLETSCASTKQAALCVQMRADIEMPLLSLRSSVALAPGKNALAVSSKNVKAVYFRLYRTTRDELKKLWLKSNSWQKSRDYYFQLDEHMTQELVTRKPAFRWSENIEYAKPYTSTDTTVSPPALENGLYVAAVSNTEHFSSGSDLVSAALLNITDLVLVGSSGIEGKPSDFTRVPGENGKTVNADVFRFYFLNAVTGEPLGNAPVTTLENNDGDAGAAKTVTTDQNGFAGIRKAVPVALNKDISAGLGAFAFRKNSWAFWQNYLNFHFSAPEILSFAIETDRPIYRPGQNVSLKATAIEKIPQGFRTYSGAQSITLKIQDPNWQTVSEKTLKPGATGSIAYSFKLPQKGLLGSYRITAELADYGETASISYEVKVEEYKRPEFEVKIDEMKAAARYNQPLKVTGSVVYYFGGAVGNGDVEYKITRQVFIPFWFWQYGRLNSSPEEVASGKIKTGPDGKFEIPFTPAPKDKDAKMPSTFLVTVSARDPGGRTITAETSVTAGDSAYLFEITPETGYFDARREGKIKVSMLNLNSAAVEGNADVKFYRLDERPANARQAVPWDFIPDTSPLDQLFENVKNGPLVFSKSMAFDGQGPSSIVFKPGKAGVYRMTVSARDPWGGTSVQSAILLFADEKGNAALGLPPVAIAKHAQASVGETAEILFGSPGLKGPVFIEVWTGQTLVKSEMLRVSGPAVYKMKVDSELKGGFAFRWFAMKNFEFLCAQAPVKVPWRDKELSVKFEYTEKNKPGQKVDWSVSVADYEGKPVNAEALVRVFDRSLEYYEKSGASALAALYQDQFIRLNNTTSIFEPSSCYLPVKRGWIDGMISSFGRAVKEPVLPFIKIAGTQMSRSKFTAMDGDVMMMSEKADTFSAPRAVGGMAPAMNKALAASGAASEEMLPAAPAARANFAETAYFNPAVKVANGKGKFSFTLPERLTSWKLGATVITNDVKFGMAQASAVTAKELMARVVLPRFLREGDKSEILLTVTNNSGGKINVKAAIRVTENGKDITSELTKDTPEANAVIAENESKTFSWPVTAPRRLTALKVRGDVTAGAQTDAEEQDLPVLPGFDRVLKSVVRILDAGTSRLAIPGVPDDAAFESATLQLDPQLALSVMNAIPQLVNYPYECTEQVVNKALPLSIADKLYDSIPDLKAAVGKIPKRATIRPAWEKDNPLRQTALEETPWLVQSEGGETQYKLTDLLNPERVKMEYADARTKLSSYQKPDGSFPWFPGGEPNLYMTLYVLDSFATAKLYGVATPDDVLKRAMAYAVGEIPKYMKADTGSLSFILYGAYVLTAYPADWQESKTAKQYARTWMQYVDRHSDALTQLGEAYGAWIYKRLGDDAKSGQYLARAIDSAQTGAEGTVFWTPEKTSWMWYSDTLETHAFLMRTLLNLQPENKLVKGMLLWMLLDRKGTEWKSTKASAAAVYSMLEFMQKNGMMTGKTDYKITWGGAVSTATVNAADFLAKPLRWTKRKISAADANAVIEKKGKGLAFGSLAMVYTTRTPVGESAGGLLGVSRKYFLRQKEGGKYTLTPLANKAAVRVGDELEVHLTINTGHQFEFVHISDPKGAGFEFDTLKSGWVWDQLSRYEEPRDSRMNFFISWLPHGEYVLAYRMRPTTPGVYHIGPAVMQSMYAPEFAANSSSLEMTVEQ